MWLIDLLILVILTALTDRSHRWQFPRYNFQFLSRKSIVLDGHNVLLLLLLKIENESYVILFSRDIEYRNKNTFLMESPATNITSFGGEKVAPSQINSLTIIPSKYLKYQTCCPKRPPLFSCQQPSVNPTWPLFIFGFYQIFELSSIRWREQSYFFVALFSKPSFKRSFS